MKAAAAPHVLLLDSYRTDLGILRAPPANVLLEGPSVATGEVLLVLRQHLPEPLVNNLARAPLRLPDGAKPLILTNVAALTPDDQTRLLAWLQGEGFGVQVVSTTERPLFDLVAEGLFDAALYYRLNVLLLRVGARGLPNDETAIAEDALGAREDKSQG